MGATREIKQPGPGHEITIEPTPGRVVVTVAGHIVADTTRALTLREGSLRPVQYIPLEDVDTSLLQPTDHTSYCPFKGDATYHSVPAGGERSVNAAWAYREPYPAVAQIAGHVAFYPDRVDELRVEEAV